MCRWLLHTLFRWAARHDLLDDVILWELPSLQAEIDSGGYSAITVSGQSVFLCHPEGGYVLAADLQEQRQAWVYADVLSEDTGLEIV